VGAIHPWAALNGTTALPAHPGIVAAYLSHLKAAPNPHQPQGGGHRPPALDGRHRSIAQGLGGGRRGMRIYPDTLAGARERALLALGFRRAFRRS
jgi:hypothetical protein